MPSTCCCTVIKQQRPPVGEVCGAAVLVAVAQSNSTRVQCRNCTEKVGATEGPTAGVFPGPASPGSMYGGALEGCTGPLEDPFGNQCHSGRPLCRCRNQVLWIPVTDLLLGLQLS